MKQKNVFLLSAWLILFVISVVSITNAQEHSRDAGDPGAGQYNLPYEIPNIDSIKNQLARIRDYFYAQPAWRIIDVKTGEPITDFSKLNPNADVERSPGGVTLWSYPTGVSYIGMLKCYDVIGDKKYLNYPITNLDFYFDNYPYFTKIDSAFGMKNNLYRAAIRTRSLDDCGSMGASLIYTYNRTKDNRYLPVINHIADYISNKQFRLKDGTLARQRPQPESVWGDDAFMCVPFLTQMGKLTGDTKYLDDAAKQIVNMGKYLFRWDKKLYDHGYNAQNEYDPSFFWGRANGWIMLATCELLDVLPENHKDREQILKLLRNHVQGLTEAQGGDGFWHNLLDKNDTFLETSCTAMFVYGIAHAVNKGWINQTFGSVAQAGWNAISSVIKPDGSVEGTCFGTTFANDNVYYYHRPTSADSHGFGPVMFAGSEMIKLLQNEKITVQLQWRTYHYRLKSDLDKIKEH